MNAPTRRDTSERLHILTDSGPLMTAEIGLPGWLAMRDHPCHAPSDLQRRQQKRRWMAAKDARGAVLERLTHVTAACWEGVYYKVEGHVRAHLWETAELTPPPTLHLTIYKVGTREELDALYTTFNPHVITTATYDKVAGVLHECGLALTSKRLRYGFIVDALNIALRGVARPDQDKKRRPPIDIHKAVTAFKAELILLDSVEPEPDVYLSGIVAAALIALGLYPDGLTFFRRLAQRQGTKREGLLDPVEAVLACVDELKQERGAWRNAQQQDLCRRTLRAFVAWQAGPDDPAYWFRRKVRAMDIIPWIQSLRAQKGIEYEREL